MLVHKDEKATPSNAQILQSLNNLDVPFDQLAVVCSTLPNAITLPHAVVSMKNN